MAGSEEHGNKKAGGLARGGRPWEKSDEAYLAFEAYCSTKWAEAPVFVRAISTLK